MAPSEPVRAAPPPSVLVVDDSPDTLEVIQRHLAGAGYPVYTCTGVGDALGFLEDNPIDLVITDLRMPTASGGELVKHVRAHLKETEIMIITGYPSVSGAVEAIRDGAGEYLVKPFTENELMSAVSRMVARLQKRQRTETPQEAENRFGIIGSAPEMLRVLRRIEEAAESDASVMISGDSGTGKERTARAVHYHGRRRAAPFVAVNCAAIPDSLLESELFGHVKGAFTGARESRVGFFEVAGGGTLFIDEVDGASAAMQAKLLRVMENSAFCMVGSSRQRAVDARIIAATRKSLADLVARGLFLEALYYRLDVIDIRLPPLSARGDDVLQLLDYFAQTLSASIGQAPLRFTDDALSAIQRYSWPGNIRELENLVQRLTEIAAAGRIDVTDLPPGMRFSPPRAPYGTCALAEVEAGHILSVLSGCGGNKSRAAEILGIDRKTLREKLKRIDARQRSLKPAHCAPTPATRDER